MANKPKPIKRIWVRESKPFEKRATDNSEFYNSRAWRNLRKRFLDSNPLCVECQKNDTVTVATVADHVIPISRGGERLSESNLQPMCKRHHDSKSSSESRTKC